MRWDLKKRLGLDKVRKPATVTVKSVQAVKDAAEKEIVSMLAKADSRVEAAERELEAAFEERSKIRVMLGLELISELLADDEVDEEIEV